MESHPPRQSYVKVTSLTSSRIIQGQTAIHQVPVPKIGPILAHGTKASCEHVDRYKEGGGGAHFSALVKYLQACRYRFAPASQLPRPVCVVCKKSSGQIYACMYCVYVGCQDHIGLHCEQRRHPLALDVASFGLKCVPCKDYVYDDDMMRVTAEVESYAQLYAERQKAITKAASVPWVPTPDQTEIIKQHSVSQTPPKNGFPIGLRGIVNMGSTCFMGSTLQLFLHNTLLRNFFLSDGHNHASGLCEIVRDGDAETDPDAAGAGAESIHDSGIMSRACLACELDRLFSEAYSVDFKGPLVPARFLYALWINSERLAGYSEQDAHEMLIAALNALHMHTSHGPTAYGDDCQCVIHRIFGGLMRSELLCMECGNTRRTQEPFFDISLGLNTSKYDDGAVDAASASVSLPSTPQRARSRKVRQRKVKKTKGRSRKGKEDSNPSQLQIKSASAASTPIKRGRGRPRKRPRSDSPDSLSRVVEDEDDVVIEIEVEGGIELEDEEERDGASASDLDVLKLKNAHTVTTATTTTTEAEVQADYGGPDEAVEKKLREEEEEEEESSDSDEEEMKSIALSLYDCLDRFTMKETLQYKLQCTTCEELRGFSKQMTITRLPPVLTFHFKRFEQLFGTTSTKKIETVVEFPLRLDMSGYLSGYVDSEKQAEVESGTGNQNVRMRNRNRNHITPGPATYTLFGSVVHEGHLDHGHYTTYIRVEGEGGGWFFVDDAEVRRADLAEVLDANTYLLFYVKDRLSYIE